MRGVDRELVDRWIADGCGPGTRQYRLLFVAGRTPPDLAEQAADVLNVMNTAPREDLDMGDIRITPELMRQYEDGGETAGEARWAYYAVEDTPPVSLSG